MSNTLEQMDQLYNIMANQILVSVSVQGNNVSEYKLWDMDGQRSLYLAQ